MPLFFKALYRWWMAFAHAVGKVNSAIILSILFIILVGPYALVSRLIGLFHRGGGSAETFWRAKEWHKPTVDLLRRQF